MFEILRFVPGRGFGGLKCLENRGGDYILITIRNSDLELNFEGRNTQMDGVGPKRGHNRGSYAQHRPVSRGHAAPSSRKQRHEGEKYWLVRSIGKVASKRQQRVWEKFKQTEFAKWPDKSKLRRLYAWLVLTLFIASTVVGILQPFIDNTVYKVTPATRGILPKQSEHLAESLKFDAKQAAFLYNDGYRPSTSANDLKMGGDGNPRFSASFAKDPTKGVKVTDPVNTVDFTLTPKFRLNSGKQDKNQVMYALANTDGFLVYTAQTASVKEDIALQSKPSKDQMVFEYELGLGDGLEAKVEKNGSIGVYGSSLPIYGNVATGSDKDTELLQKAKQNATKDKFLFGIPAPVVKEAGKNGTNVSTKFELSGKTLKVVANNLKGASYPLTIDPSVYIQSAAQLMYGNNETNVEFDVATEQFKKGTTTGARIDAWTESTDMSKPLWDQGTVTSGSYVYTAGGRTSRTKPRVVDQTASTLSTTSLNFTMNMPATRPAGDLYVAVIAHDVNGTNTITPPAGWTAIQTTTREHAIYYRIGTNVSGGNEAASYQWTKAGTAVQWAGTILRIKDFAFSGSVATITSSSTTNTSGNPSLPAVTATDVGALLIRSASVNDATPADSGYSPASHSDIASGSSGGAAGVGYVVSELYDPPASGSSTTAATVTALSGAYGASSLVIYGNATTAALSSTVQWAHFNNTTGAIDSPTPGSNAVACSGWCNNSAYDLPISSPSATNGAGLVATAMVAYNGYLYVMGGYDGTYIKSTVYIAKLGSNGEPQLWHPTDSNQSNWVYWYKDSGLSGATAKQYMSAYAYNGKMYVLGGDTDASNNTTGATTAVQIADILPNGTLGSWSSGQALTSARYAATVQGYNGYLYIMGGNTGSATINTVEYSKINSDGTMNSWLSAAADGTGTGFTSARASRGGTMSGVWGGYLYIAGGCAVINANGYCTSTLDDVQLASINADGTLDNWNTMANIKNKRFGDSFIAWQDSLYRFGGCEFQDPTTGECYATHKTVQYGAINQDGDASTVSISQAFGSGNCVTPDPYNCDIPSGEGQMLTVSVILNGYLYNIGGCTTAACGTMSGNIVYAAIDSNGRLKNPPTCAGTLTGAWCSDSTNAVPGGVGAAGATVFGGTIYLLGGQDGSGGKNTIYRNTVSADGSLAGAWTNTTFTAAGLTAYNTNGLSYTYVYSRANPASAGTNPGNLYVFGGCDNPAANAGCTGGDSYADAVYKCNIQTSGAIAGCTTTGQMALTQVTGSTTTGIGIHAGTVYANYIYIIGGFTDGVPDLNTVRYAKFDNSNNVVAVSGSTWITSSITMVHGRRRGAAFGYNGYIYAVGGYDSGSTQILDTIEYVKINVSDGSLISTNPTDSTKFAQSAVTFNQRWGLGMAVSNSYAYIIGGCKVGASPTCTTLDSTVQTFQLYNNDSGAPGGYSAASNLYATDRIGAGAAVLNGYMYIAGGCTGGLDCGTVTTNVQRASIDANGVVGSWSNTTAALPTAGGGGLAYGQLEVAGGGLYFLGGQNSSGTVQSNVYYATLSGNDVTAWNTATKGIGDTGSGAQARTQFSSAVWNNRIYVTGGNNGSATAQTTVYVSPQLNSGGNITTNWTSTTGFNIARNGHTVIAYANNLYILGGYDGTNYLSDVQFAKLDSTNGTISGSWTYTTNLPFGLRQADGFASNGYMYIFGGRNSTNDCTSRTLIAPISANTTIASGNNPTGIGEWYQTNRNFDGGRYGVAAVNYQGKAYVLGGGCQGIVMQDNFDPTLDASQWTSTTGMSVGTTCQSNSASNVLYMTDGASGANSAITKDVNVASGGTIFFKFFSPAADGGGCFAREANLFGGSPDNVTLRYSIDGGTNWVNIATYPYNTDYDPMTQIAQNIPINARTASTRFQWYMLTGEANDSFSLEDVYIVSTGNATVSYPQDRVSQTPLLSQPQVAIYSRLVDAGNDAFPRKFLMNGLDNSIGARWQMAYRSMNDPTNTTNPCGGSVMTGYGALTSFGDVTLGTPGTYTMKNGAGTDIGCGRYFFMNISIDASQTYGYPDDITRGPTLDNLTLFYNSNPGKRLIHGKTFTEGIQQPLDTQP
jgi:hypothetical protein